MLYNKALKFTHFVRWVAYTQGGLAIMPYVPAPVIEKLGACRYFLAMRKVNVIGTSGSGKSYFSKRLAKKLNAPYIEMDAIFWQQNWQGLETADFLAKVKEAINQATFVLDGNHSKTNKVKWHVVDTIIWLDLGFWRTFSQIIRRSISRSFSKTEIWQGTGNKESFHRNFLSSESVVLWMLKNYWKTKAKYRILFQEKSQTNINLVHLTSWSEVEAFLFDVERT